MLVWTVLGDLELAPPLHSHTSRPHGSGPGEPQVISSGGRQKFIRVSVGCLCPLSSPLLGA